MSETVLTKERSHSSQREHKGVRRYEYSLQNYSKYFILARPILASAWSWSVSTAPVILWLPLLRDGPWIRKGKGPRDNLPLPCFQNHVDWSLFLSKWQWKLSTGLCPAQQALPFRYKVCKRMATVPPQSFQKGNFPITWTSIVKFSLTVKCKPLSCLVRQS